MGARTGGGAGHGLIYVPSKGMAPMCLVLSELRTLLRTQQSVHQSEQRQCEHSEPTSRESDGHSLKVSFDEVSHVIQPWQLHMRQHCAKEAAQFPSEESQE